MFHFRDDVMRCLQLTGFASANLFSVHVCEGISRDQPTWELLKRISGTGWEISSFLSTL